MTKPTFTNIHVGADPEFFLTKDGMPVSAHEVVPGSKEKPFPLKNGVCIQADGTAVEFNIPPAATADAFANSIQDALNQIRELVPKEYSFSFTPSVKFDKTYFSNLPENTKRLGCDPDYMAQRLGLRSSIVKATDLGTTRVAGGHIHVGWGKDLDPKDEGHFFDCVNLVASLDNRFRSLTQFWDTDKLRPKFYGADGAFRPKSYGVEYRGLSNAWLRYPKLWPWLFHNTVAAVQKLKTGTYFSYYERMAATEILYYEQRWQSPPVRFESSLIS